MPPFIKPLKRFLTMLSLTLSTPLTCLEPSAATTPQHTSIQQPSNHLIRRAAFDIGSGQIKMQVSDVDTKTNRITNVLLTNNAIVALREDLAKSPDCHFSAEIQNKLILAISDLLQKTKTFHPQEIHAIATESFRLAKNGPALAARIKSETGLDITIISQEEEGILGFLSATNEANVNPEKVVSWDFGGGSIQITTKCGEQYVTCKGIYGSVPFKNAIICLQGKTPLQTHTPNPISAFDMDVALSYYIQDSINSVPLEILEKLELTDTVVLGVGLNPLWTMENNSRYNQQRVLIEIEKRLGLDDEAIKKLDSIVPTNPSSAAAMVSNLILTYGLMQPFGIREIQYVGTPGANAIGALLSPNYWKKP